MLFFRICDFLDFEILRSQILLEMQNLQEKISKQPIFSHFYIYKSTPKKFGPNRRSGTHFLKSLLFGQNSLVFSNFLKIFTYKA